MAKIDTEDIISFGEWSAINSVGFTAATRWRTLFTGFPKPIYKYGSNVVYLKSDLDRFYVNHWWLGLSAAEIEEQFNKVTPGQRALYIHYRIKRIRNRWYNE